ncbi:hypothetical protein ACHAWT_005928 [Skeletonema menzelii]
MIQIHSYRTFRMTSCCYHIHHPNLIHRSFRTFQKTRFPIHLIHRSFRIFQRTSRRRCLPIRCCFQIHSCQTCLMTRCPQNTIPPLDPPLLPDFPEDQSSSLPPHPLLLPDPLLPDFPEEDHHSFQTCQKTSCCCLPIRRPCCPYSYRICQSCSYRTYRRMTSYR